MGTADPTAHLCVPEAIQFMASLLPDGWSAVMNQNHTMATAARQRLCEALKVEPLCPEEMIGSMAVVPLPVGFPSDLKAQLLDRYQIEVPVIPWQDSQAQFIRVSAQLYNTLSDYDQLARALVELQCGIG
jgi:isopenicillin-N epimerase